MSQRTAFSLNVAIVATYVSIAVLSPTPWIMLGGFLLFALLIRCATLYTVGMLALRESDASVAAAFAVLALNLSVGLAFSVVVVAALYWLGHFWLAGIKIIVPILAVFVAYRSLVPLPHEAQ